MVGHDSATEQQTDFVTRNTLRGFVQKHPEIGLCHLLSDQKDIWWALRETFSIVVGERCLRISGGGAVVCFSVLALLRKMLRFFLRHHTQDHSIASGAYVSV